MRLIQQIQRRAKKTTRIDQLLQCRSDNMNQFTAQHPFKRNGKALRASKTSVLLYRTDCGADEKDQFLQTLQQPSVSLTGLHATANCAQQHSEARMAQLESLEAKMANIEVSLSATPRRKKSSSVSGGVSSASSHRGHREHYKELDSLRVALRDKENIIQTLKGQLCNTLSSRLALRNGGPPLTEADRKATEERLERLKRDADNKRLAIKSFKLALDRLDITDNIDVRIQQAELEYRLGREELELLTLREESRALQAALDVADSQDKQRTDTIFSCIGGSTQLTVHALEVGADPTSPRFGAAPRENAAGLYVDWAVQDSGLCKGDRILEVNGKLVLGAGRGELARLLAVAPDAAQLVVLRRNDCPAALRTLRSDNLRLTHRIGYLEEQVRDLLAPRAELPVELEAGPAPAQHRLQVFQKGPQVTALVSAAVASRASPARQDCAPAEAAPHPRSSRSARSHGHGLQQQRQLARSTASLELGQAARRAARPDEQQARQRSRRPQPHDFDSEPTYYGRQEVRSGPSGHSAHSEASQHCPGGGAQARPAPPKKPLRLSLHRATSLQSVESAPPGVSAAASLASDQGYVPSKKPTKRNYRGDPPPPAALAPDDGQQQEAAPQPPPRAPSRAESCQSALRWSSPKPKTSHLPQFSLEKWC